MCGPGLKGSTIGLVGFGRIGQEVCRKLKAFNVAKILYTDSGKKSKTEGKCIPAKIWFHYLVDITWFHICKIFLKKLLFCN